jgi:hypothetical protein
MVAQSNPKPLPAFGRDLIARRRRGVVPANRTVAISHGWPYLSAFKPWRVVISVEMDPRELDYSFVAGLDVLLVAVDPEDFFAIAAAVAQYKPRVITGACIDPPQLLIYRPAC